MDLPDLPQLSLLITGAVAAGWVDAVIGGGGLVLIPLLLMVPGVSPATALGTNKVAAVWGTASAAVLYLRQVRVNPRILGLGLALGSVSAAAGAASAAAIQADVMRPIVITLMLAVGVFVAFKPNFGGGRQLAPNQRLHRRQLALLAVLFIGIGFYDGIFGPGTGMFLIFGLTAILSSNFLESATIAKVVNTGTNLGALVVFASQGNVLWALGLILAVGNIAGSFVGSKMVFKVGTSFVRYALLAVVVIMSAKLIYDQLHA